MIIHIEGITLILKLNLKLQSDHSDVYVLLSRSITVTGAVADDVAEWLDEKNKGVICKDCAASTDCISKINNTQIENVKYIDVVMPMHNLIECSDDYLKTSGGLW